MDTFWTIYGLVSALIVVSLKCFGLIVAAYIFYYRVWDYYWAVRFYKAQGATISPYYMPIIGSAYWMVWSAYKSWKEGDNYFILKHGLDYQFNVMKLDVGISFVTNGAGLAIGDVKVIEAMYTTKNKYFDKHPLIKDLAMPLTGDSILFTETSETWRKERKAMSPAFYKGKLEDLVELAKGAVRKTITRWESTVEK